MVKVTLKESITDTEGISLDGDAPNDGSGRGYIYNKLK